MKNKKTSTNYKFKVFKALNSLAKEQVSMIKVRLLTTTADTAVSSLFYKIIDF